jgi:DNA-binding LacI/PurR family transcriptional regulator
MASLKDIAAKCKVSVATVSKALNDQSDIGKETKENIRKAAEEMGYFPNSAARMLKTKRSNNIGILFIDKMHSGLAHEYFSSVLENLKSEAEKRGYDITFYFSKHRTTESKLSGALQIPQLRWCSDCQCRLYRSYGC